MSSSDCYNLDTEVPYLGDYIYNWIWQEQFLNNVLLLFKWWMGLCARHVLLKKRCFSVTVPVQYMSCWTGLNVFDHVRSYDNPFQQTDNHMELYQKLCVRVNSGFAIWGFKKLEFWNSLYDFYFTLYMKYLTLSRLYLT